MDVEATRTAPLELSADTIVLGIFEGEPVDEGLLGAESARAQAGFTTVAYRDGARFLLVGLGPRDELDAERMRVVASKAQQRVSELRSRRVCWQLPPARAAEFAAAIVQGMLLRSYRFERYKLAEPDAAPERLIISCPDEVSAAVRDAAALCAAQNRARDLVNTPANDLTPAALAGYAQALAAQHEHLKAEVMDEDQIRERGLGAFAAVAQGSAQGARLIKLHYEAGPGDAPLLGLIGKAVTFDAGGLSLKPAAKMHEMKFDMAGGAAVIEAIAALAELGAPARVLGLIGATENLPSGSAAKPGDIVTALDGTTIEIDNTDAEGRLVLADCLSLARQEGCERLIDVATLTGGVLVALGSLHAGLFCNDEALAAELQRAADLSGELVWRLPLHPRYAEMVKGRDAQLTNHSERREASPVTGAEFLHHFAGDVPWAHLDIAGTAYDVPLEYFAGKGATGFGVRLLAELARSE